MSQEIKVSGRPGAQFQVEGNRQVILIRGRYGCYLVTALHI